MKQWIFENLWQGHQWQKNVAINTDQEGTILTINNSIDTQYNNTEIVKGYTLAGFPNAHSHAFQYAMAGRAETALWAQKDTFWTWRELMYKTALSLNPTQMQHVAEMLYAEMLRLGYTHVVEFHYLHHQPNGKPYENLAEMGERLIEAAQNTGIGITLIPVLYQKGGFQKDALPEQRRFISSNLEQYYQLLEKTQNIAKQYKNVQTAASFHSLRAVDTTVIQQIFKDLPESIIHTHAAEQLQEVEDCLQTTQQRPVEWLLNNTPLGEKHFLVHCTHLTKTEVEQLAKSKATAILCTGTEGNLGDGVFKLTDYQNQQGKWAIGSDSQICLSPFEEIRWTDYHQRTQTHRRNTFDFESQKQHPYHQTIFQGRAAANLPFLEDYFQVGMPLDAIIIDDEMPLLAAAETQNILPIILYNADSQWIKGTITQAKWRVKNQKHEKYEIFKYNYQQTLLSIGKK